MEVQELADARHHPADLAGVASNGGRGLGDREGEAVLPHGDADAGGDEDREPVAGAELALRDLGDHGAYLGGAGGGEADHGGDSSDLGVAEVDIPFPGARFPD